MNLRDEVDYWRGAAARFAAEGDEPAERFARLRLRLTERELEAVERERRRPTRRTRG